jgi:hypothetical protein
MSKRALFEKLIDARGGKVRDFEKFIDEELISGRRER